MFPLQDFFPISIARCCTEWFFSNKIINRPVLMNRMQHVIERIKEKLRKRRRKSVIHKDSTKSLLSIDS